MAHLPLTTNEKNLLGQIQQEIERMSQEFDDSMKRIEGATNSTEIDELMRLARNRSRGIRQRSETREVIIRDALNRMTQ